MLRNDGNMKPKFASNIHGLVTAQLTGVWTHHNIDNQQPWSLGVWTLDPTTTQGYPTSTQTYYKGILEATRSLQVHTQVYPPASIEFLQGCTQAHSTTNLDDSIVQHELKHVQI